MNLKKVALILLLAMLLGIGVASAKILTNQDKFTGGTRYTSYNDNLKGVSSIGLHKIIDNQNVNYELNVSAYALPKENFSKEYAEIKVGQNLAIKAEVKAVRLLPTLNYMSTDIKISDEAIQQILESERVALKLYVENGTPIVFVLPDNVLAEWKEVIATEK
jgi:uncharacterized protein YeeX (DUF496 family)